MIDNKNYSHYQVVQMILNNQVRDEKDNLDGSVGAGMSRYCIGSTHI